MKVGAPFNPYKVFQGIFAPYWVLEHRGISTGAKLCYIRLLGFAGRDARCYPSVETLGASLGVSGRQARDYVRELERANLIAVEQRGLRKTNVYLFIWTEELERLTNAVPDRCEDPDQPDSGMPGNGAPDRNRASDPDRNSSSALDRKYAAGLDRNCTSGPIGRNSPGRNSSESSFSYRGPRPEEKNGRKHRSAVRRRADELELNVAAERASLTAEAIRRWAAERHILRLRTDRAVGLPEENQLARWAVILDARGIVKSDDIFAVLDNACLAAKKIGDWRNWAYLTLQIQLAAERFRVSKVCSAQRAELSEDQAEDPNCDWAAAKAKIRQQIPEIAFANWFHRTRQVSRHGVAIVVAAPDEPTRCYLMTEYGEIIHAAVSSLGIKEIRFIVQEPTADALKGEAVDSGHG